MIYRDEITYFIGEGDLFTGVAAAVSGTPLPGNTPIHFAGVQFYEPQTAKKGTALIANDHKQTTRLDLGIAER